MSRSRGRGGPLLWQSPLFRASAPSAAARASAPRPQGRRAPRLHSTAQVARPGIARGAPQPRRLGGWPEVNRVDRAGGRERRSISKGEGRRVGLVDGQGTLRDLVPEAAASRSHGRPLDAHRMGWPGRPKRAAEQAAAPEADFEQPVRRAEAESVQRGPIIPALARLSMRRSMRPKNPLGCPGWRTTKVQRLEGGSSWLAAVQARTGAFNSGPGSAWRGQRRRRRRRGASGRRL